MRRLLPLLLLAATAAHAAVTGTVVTADGAPVAGARVRAFAREPFSVTAARLISANPEAAPLATAQSDAEGRFSIDTKGNTAVDLVVDAAGKVPHPFSAADGDDAGALILRDAAKARRVKVTIDGKPLPNALVYLGRGLIMRTGADGMVEGVPSGEASYVIHPDYGVSIANDRDGIIEFRRGGTIKGRVVARDGKTPVAGATIVAGGWPLAQSGADGSFTIAHAPALLRAVLAVSGNDAGAATAETSKPIEIRLGTGASLKGRVTVAKSPSTPVAGALVAFTHAGELYSALSDAKGNYVISALPPGSYQSQANHPAYGFARGGELRAGTVPVHTFALPPRALVRGVVVGEDKKPVAGAFVGAGFGGGNLAVTPATGEFSVRLGGTNPSFVAASKSGYATAVSAPLELEPGAAKSGVTLTLQRGFPLQVKIVDPGRAPVANANVDLVAPIPGRPFGTYPLPCSVADRMRCRTTGSDGTLDLRLVPGKYDLRVSGDFVAKNLREQALDAKSSPLVITVERGADVSGRVVYSDGTPAPGTSVNLVMGNGTGGLTDQNGLFTLKQLPRVPTTLVASTGGESTVRSAPVKITPPAHDVTLTIPTPAVLEGRVTDRATSQPVTSFSIMATQRGGIGSSRSDVTSDDGAYSLKVQPGALDVHVNASGYVSATVSDLMVEDGKTLSGVDVKLDRGARVVGHVTGGGNAISGARIRTSTRRTAPFTTTDANGDYTLDGVTPGEATIDITKEGFVAKHKTLTVEAGKDARLDVDLDRGRELHGRVNDKSGQPLGGVRISASTTASPTTANAMTESDGQFTISGLEDAHYHVTAQKNGYVTAALDDVDATAAQPLALTLDRGATLTGRVVGLPAEELGSVNVSAASRSGGSTTQTDAGGNFTLTGIPDGRVTLSGYRQGLPPRQSPPVSIDVTNGSAPPVEIDFSAGLTIRGRVTRNGVPVTSGNVLFLPRARAAGRIAQGMIAADGSYEVNGAEQGDYAVRVNSMGSSSEAPPYTVTGNGVYDIDLRGTAVRGVVLDATSNAPLPDARILAMTAGEGPRTTRGGISDSEGRFTLDILPDGAYTVRAEREHYAPASQNMTVSGGAASPVELRLTRGTEIAVRIVDATSGAPVDGAVMLVDEQKKYVASSNGRGDDGAAHVWAAPGRYSASVHAPGYVNENIDVVIPGPEVRVALSRAASLTISSRTGGRFRLSGSVGEPGGVSRMIVLRAGERQTLGNLRPGAMQVAKVTDDLKTVLQTYTVVLTPGQTATLDAD